MQCPFPFNPKIEVSQGGKDGLGHPYFVLKYSSYGCYPLVYVPKDSGVLCT